MLGLALRGWGEPTGLDWVQFLNPRVSVSSKTQSGTFISEFYRRNTDDRNNLHKQQSALIPEKEKLDI